MPKCIKVVNRLVVMCIFKLRLGLFEYKKTLLDFGITKWKIIYGEYYKFLSWYTFPELLL